MKLNIDITEFLIGDNETIYMTTIGEDEVSTKPGFKALNFPFIKYLEGSYFGDVDFLVPGLKHCERDSTAIASSKESHFFVLSREILLSLRRTFGKEI